MRRQNSKEQAGCRRYKRTAGLIKWRAGRGRYASLLAGAAPSHGTSSGVRQINGCRSKDRRYKCTPQFLQRIQERDQVGHFFLRQIHLETLVVKIQQLGEVLCGAVVKIGSAGGEAPQNGTFDAVHVAA